MWRSTELYYEVSMDSNLEQRSLENLDLSCLPESENAVPATDNKKEMAEVSGNLDSNDVPLKTESWDLDVAVNQMSDITAKPKSLEVNTEDSGATESVHEGKDDVIYNSQLLFDEIDDCTPNVAANDFGAVMENAQEKDDSKCNIDSLKDDKNSTTVVDIEKYN